VGPRECGIRGVLCRPRSIGGENCEAEWREVSLGSAEVRVLVPDAHSALERAAEDGTDVYWCTLWPSALPVAQALHGAPPRVDVRGKAVVDVGCGLGLAGVSAAAAGAGSVVFTDFVAEAVGLAVQSAREAVVAGAHGAAVTGSVLNWSDIDAWPAAAYDVALLADVLYEASAVDALVVLLRRILKAEGSIAVVADQAKRTPSNRARFVAGMISAGFSVADEPVAWTEQDRRVLHQVLGFGEGATPPPTIHLLICTRS